MAKQMLYILQFENDNVTISDNTTIKDNMCLVIKEMSEWDTANMEGMFRVVFM